MHGRVVPLSGLGLDAMRLANRASPGRKKLPDKTCANHDPCYSEARFPVPARSPRSCNFATIMFNEEDADTIADVGKDNDDDERVEDMPR